MLAVQALLSHGDICIFSKSQSVIKNSPQVFVALDNFNTYTMNDCGNTGLLAWL